jgi:uncharacterized protein YceH (UPF0502 family)
MDLSSAEIRVLGCLLEKQRTTPDHYPLSLNSLRLACNQSTNREPVVQYDEAVVRDALRRLERRGYARLAGAGRAAKYRHLLAEAMPMSDPEQAVMCVLMLRGVQTPGELKQRGERIHAFADLSEVHQTLAGLIERELVARLPRRPGQKEERYAQLLSEQDSPNGSFAPTGAGRSDGAGELAATGASAGPAFADSVSAASLGPVSGVSLDSDVSLDSGASADAAPLESAGRAGGGESSLVAELRERVQRLEREVAELREAMQS